MIRWRIDAAAQRLVVDVEGTVTLEDIVSTITDASSHPDFTPSCDVLSDHLRVERPITPNQAHGMVAHLRSLSHRYAHARWAVVTRNPASYGMMRMVAVLAEQVPMHVEIFETVADAEAWLEAQRGEGEQKQGA